MVLPVWCGRTLLACKEPWLQTHPAPLGWTWTQTARPGLTAQHQQPTSLMEHFWVYEIFFWCYSNIQGPHFLPNMKVLATVTNVHWGNIYMLLCKGTWECSLVLKRLNPENSHDQKMFDGWPMSIRYLMTQKKARNSLYWSWKKVFLHVRLENCTSNLWRANTNISTHQ